MAGETAEFMWAVGLYEGEGTAVPRRVGRSGARMAVKMNDEDVVRRFAAAVDVGKVIGPYPHGLNGKSMWIWNLYRWDHMEPLLRRMLPHLGKRRVAQAERVLALPPTRRGSPRRAV